ncbi:MAG: GGDEF domain-containing protein, partial [Coriobacteriia bacterium]
SELERLMQGIAPGSLPAQPAGARRPSPVKELSLTDGFPRRTLEEKSRTDPSIVAVRGLRALDELLAAIHMGETAPVVVDMLNCEGCIDGPAVRPGMSVFAKRNIIAADRRESVAPRIRTRDLLGFLPPVDLRRSFVARPAPMIEPTGEEIENALLQGEFTTPEQHLDCGACGHATCREHAIAVGRGDSSWDTCFPLQRRRMMRAAQELERTASIDALTGLANRRAFDERLAGESARHARYGGELSLLMMDIDGFKAINDTHGHIAGDAVLKAVASIIGHYVRATDLAARYGGDEFALIMPGTGDVAAAAVGEKLRRAVAGCKVVPGDGLELAITLSIGLSSLGDSTVGHTALLEASDKAMYAAKREGKNQVRSAPR